MSIWAYIAAAVVIFIAGGAAAHRYDMGQFAIKENARLELVREKEKANRSTERTQSTQVIGALNASNKRAQVAQASAVAAADTAGRLRDDIADLQRRLPSASLDACRTNAAALATVFGQCTDRLRTMGRNAQGHADDTLTLEQAWPH